MESNDDRRSKPQYWVIPHYRVLFYIGLGTLISGLGWLVVIRKLDPYTQPDFALPLFFLTTLITSSGLFTILLAWIKKWKTRDQIYLKHVLISLRQGILLSFCTTISLGLLMLGFLRVWNGLLIVTIMMLVEFYLSGKDEL